MRECKGENFAQIIYKEVKKAYRKQSNKHKKCCTNNSEVTAIPTIVHEEVGWLAQGNPLSVRNIN